MKRFIIAFCLILIPILSFGQKDSNFEVRENLKEFVDKILKNQKGKPKIFLNNKEIVNPSEYEINLDDLKMKVEMKGRNIDGIKEEEIELRITAKQFKIS